MKRAVALPLYRNTQAFDPPAGIVEEAIDPQSGQLATPSCPETADEYFIAGSEPTQYCELHGGEQSSGRSGAGSRIFSATIRTTEPPPAVNTTRPAARPAQNQRPNPAQPASRGKSRSASGEPVRRGAGEEKGLARPDIWYLRWKQAALGQLESQAAAVVDAGAARGRAMKRFGPLRSSVSFSSPDRSALSRFPTVRSALLLPIPRSQARISLRWPRNDGKKCRNERGHSDGAQAIRRSGQGLSDHPDRRSARCEDP